MFSLYIRQKTVKKIIGSLAIGLLFTVPASLAATTPLDPLAANPPQNLSASGASSGVKTEVYQKITVSQIQGEVSVRKSGALLYDRITGDTAIQMGDSVKTENGACELLMENHTSLTLQPHTTLNIDEATFDKLSQSRVTMLKLDAGRIKAKIGKLEHGSRFEVLTPTALAAVRGTEFYLNAGTTGGQSFTELFVSESASGVDFSNNKSGIRLLISALGATSAFGDGSLPAQQTLTQAQKKEFIDHWESILRQALGQQSIEQNNTASNSTPTQSPTSNTNDAAKDKQSEQNVGSGVVNNSALSALGASGNTSAADWLYDLVKYNDGTTPLGDGLMAPSGPGDLGIVSDDRSLPGADLDALREAERAQMRAEIHHDLERIHGDLDLEREIGNGDRIIDAQTGKVFTDVSGYRVRVDQYIFRPSANAVQILSLTQRAAGSSAGISSASFGIEFNRDITSADGPIRNLPWNDYLNVVTDKEMAAQIPSLDGGGGATIMGTDLYSQYLVHESAPGLAQGTSALFPKHFYAEFSNPNRGTGDAEVRDRIRFDEVYTDPMTYYLNVKGLNALVVQGRMTDSTQILPYGSDAITIINHYGSLIPEIYLNGNLTYQNASGGTPADLAMTPDASLITYYGYAPPIISAQSTIALPIDPFNLGGIDPKGSVIPAFHLQTFGYYQDDKPNSKALIGIFVPIDNQGNILRSDAPDGSGFRLRGLRDFISPNPNVNGGNYNLEVIFKYGDINLSEGGGVISFAPQFSIDTIITPEIFNGTGPFNTINHSNLFPASLDAPPVSDVRRDG